MRAIAVLLVFFMHSYSQAAAPVTEFQEDLYLPMMFGWVGVDFFFVLSGFLITGILIETRDDPHFLKKFYIRRTLRIFPLYYFVLFSYIFIDIAFNISNTEDTNYFFHIFYITNWDEFFGYERPQELDHFWSLAIEEQFYLFWPSVFLILRDPKKLKYFCIGVICFSIIFRCVSALNGHIAFAYDNTFCRLDALMCGALLAILIREDGFKIKTGDVAVYLCMGLFIVLFIFLDTGHFFARSSTVAAYGIPALPLIFGSLILYVFLLDETHAYRRSLCSPILIYLGKISYGIYIYHWFIIRFLNEMNVVKQETFGYFGAQIVFFVLSGLITVVVASLSYRYMEQPILGLKDRYAPYDKKP